LRNAEYGSRLECLLAITFLNGMHFELITNGFGRKLKPLLLMALDGVILSNLNNSLMVEELYWHYTNNVKGDHLCLLARIKPMQA
jgi:hypothetical protein